MTAWMHIGGGEVPEANGDPSRAVRSNVQRAKQQIIRIGPLLKISEVRKRRKAECIEAFVMPALLYGLATIVLRVTDDRKLSAVLNIGKRMALVCWSRREKTV